LVHRFFGIVILEKATPYLFFKTQIKMKDLKIKLTKRLGGMIHTDSYQPNIESESVVIGKISEFLANQLTHELKGCGIGDSINLNMSMSTVSRLMNDDEIKEELKETAFYYGGWDELREVIRDLETNEAEEAHERMVEDFHDGDGSLTVQERYVKDSEDKRKNYA
jgi:hypothetical protein